VFARESQKSGVMILGNPPIRATRGPWPLPCGDTGAVNADDLRDLCGPAKFCDDSRRWLHSENVAIITTSFKNNCSEFDNGLPVALYATLCRWFRTSRAGSTEP
jgi:hypothetical protein